MFNSKLTRQIYGVTIGFPLEPTLTNVSIYSFQSVSFKD